MSVTIKWFSVFALGLASCGSSAPTEMKTSNPLMAVNEQVERPLAPSQLEFVHVEFSGTGSVDTYIRTNQILGQVFGNLVFASDNPLVSSLTHRARPDLPRLLVTSKRRRIGSILELTNKLQALSGERTYPGVASLDKLADPLGYIFIFPNSDEYDTAVKSIRTSDIKGLKAMTPISNDCSYSRISLDAGNKQAAIMLMRSPNRSVQFNDPADRACLLGFFAANWGMAPADIQSLVFGNTPLSRGRCEIARILIPGTRDNIPSDQTGCPTPAPRNPESVVTYARRLGVGLTPSHAEAVIASARSLCNNLAPGRKDIEASCRRAFEGSE